MEFRPSSSGLFPLLKVSKDRDTAVSLAVLLQFLISLIMKVFSCTLETLLLQFMSTVSHSPTVHFSKESGSVFFVIPKVPWSLFSWTCWTSSAPSPSTHRASAPAPNHLGGSLLNLLQLTKIFPVLRSPKLDAVLQKWSNESQAEVIEHLPWSSGYNPIFTPKYTVSSPHPGGTHVWFTVHQDSQGLSSRVATHPFSAQPALMQGVRLSPVQDIAFLFVNYHKVHSSSTFI